MFAMPLAMVIMLPFLDTFITRNLLYPRVRLEVPQRAPAHLTSGKVFLHSGKSAQIWYHDHKEQPRAAILFLHGNGENLETMNRSGLYREFQKLKIHFVALDYPGYGNSEGHANEKDNIEAAIRAFEFMQKQWPDVPHIIAGWSLGAAVAMGALDQRDHGIDGIILMSAWRSLADVARHHFGDIMSALLVGETYDSMKAAASSRTPALVIHGLHDRLIPSRHGRDLARQFRDSIWVEISNAGHNDLLSSQKVWQNIDVFIEDLTE